MDGKGLAHGLRKHSVQPAKVGGDGAPQHLLDHCNARTGLILRRGLVPTDLMIVFSVGRLEGGVASDWTLNL